MICPHCQQEQPETVRFCQNCGAVLSETETTPETETVPAMEDTIVAEPENAFAPPVKKKRLGLLIIAVLAVLAAGVVVCSFVFDWWGTNTPVSKPIVPADTAPVVEKVDNFTMEMVLSLDIEDSMAVDMDITAKVAPSLVWMKAESTSDELPFSAEIGVVGTKSEGALIAVLAEDNSGRPPYAAFINDDGASEPTVSPELFTELFKTEPADFDIESFIDKYDELSVLYAYEEDGIISIEGLEQAIRNLMTVLRDKEWLTTTFGYTKTESENLTVHSINTDLAVIAEAFAKEIAPATAEQTAPVLETLPLYSEALKNSTLNASLAVRGNIPELMSVAFKSEGVTFSLDATVTDVNKTVIDIDALKDAVIETNEGYTVCRECNILPPVYQGYCELCYDAYHCDECFAPVSPEETVCEDCFVPCISCGELANYDNNGENYCFECYYDRFCFNDDNNPVYKDGYCEDCFVPCEICGAYADYPTEDTLYCWSCYYERYCYNDDGNPVFMDGYCEDCFVPCVACGAGQSEEEFDGMCYSCYYDKYCIICGGEAYTEGYCEDCYTPCTVCGKGGGNDYYDGLCWKCYFDSVE